MSAPVEVFISYAAVDDGLCRQLESHLSVLTQLNLISAWHPRKIVAGEDYNRIASEKLESAHLILLLVSPDFMASPYLYGTELRRALERNAAGTAKVIPIIIRPLDLSPTPFNDLMKLPSNGDAVTKWRNIDAAWTDVVRAIRHMLERAGSIPAHSVVGSHSAATPIPGLRAASPFQPSQYPYGPAGTGPRSGGYPQASQYQFPGAGEGHGASLQSSPTYISSGSRQQNGAALQTPVGSAAPSHKTLLVVLLAGAGLLALMGVILTKVLGSPDEGGCRVPVPETRRVDPPTGHTSGALRSTPVVASTPPIEDVPRGTFVTIMSAGRGGDQECWYRVRVKGSERTGWIHSVNIP